MAEVYEGRPITVCSLETLALLDELAALDAFVAVTTRSLHQLQRVEPIWERARRSWAICANGATLLSHGVVDQEWNALVDELCGGCASPAEAEAAVYAAFGPAGPESWLLRVRDCDARFLYAICELGAAPGGPRGRRERGDAPARLGRRAARPQALHAAGRADQAALRAVPRRAHGRLRVRGRRRLAAGRRAAGGGGSRVVPA